MPWGLCSPTMVANSAQLVLLESTHGLGVKRGHMKVLFRQNSQMLVCLAFFSSSIYSYWSWPASSFSSRPSPHSNSKREASSFTERIHARQSPWLQMSLQSHFHWLIGDVPLVQEGTQLIYFRNGLGQGQPASPQPVPAQEKSLSQNASALYPKGAQLTLCLERLAPAPAQSCH